MKCKLLAYLTLFGLLGSFQPGCIRIGVEDDDGRPVDGFTARIDERGGRTTTRIREVATGATLHYLQKDPQATTVVFVEKETFHPGMAVLEPWSFTGGYLKREVDITLFPESECIEIPEDCLDATVTGIPGEDYVPGDVIAHVNSWLWQAEIAMAFRPYCLTPDESPFGDTFAMWAEVRGVSTSGVVVALEASAIVSWAKQRGWPNGWVPGTTILVQFNEQATINAARDLLDSIEGVRWLETSLWPQWALLRVPPGTEGPWICTLERDPLVHLATINGILHPWPPLVP